MDKRFYGQDALFIFPLIDAGTQNFVTDYTPAAGDAKVWTDKQISANPTAEVFAFTSGSEEPTPGATLVGASSSSTCTLMFALRTSGTWAGGDAAGFLFIKAASDAFSGENINISGGTSNVLTVAGDCTAGLTCYLGNGLFAAALTAAEMTCKLGGFNIVDSSTKACEDQSILFVTKGHPLAHDPFEGLAIYDTRGAGTPQAADATTVTLPATADSDNDAYCTVLMVESGKPVMAMSGTYVGSTKVFTYDPAPGITFTTGATVYPMASPKAQTTTPIAANVTQLGGAAQSATDLKDFADTGYDPSTHKVQGLVLADTCTTNTDMRGTDSAATAANLATLAAYVDTEVAAILEDTGTTLDGKIDTIDTVVDAIRAKTDSLTFTVAGEVDANVQSVNNVELAGDGDTTPMGAA